MQVDDPPGAAALVQAVDILSHDLMDEPQPFQLREGPMGAQPNGTRGQPLGWAAATRGQPMRLLAQ